MNPLLVDRLDCVQEYGVIRNGAAHTQRWTGISRDVVARRGVNRGFLAHSSMRLLATLTVLLGIAGTTFAVPTAEEGRREFLRGEYDKVVRMSAEALDDRPRDEAWHRLRTEALMAVGKYREAHAALTNGLGQMPRSIVLRWLGREVYALNGQPEKASEAVAEIPRLVSRSPWAYREPLDLITVGRSLLAAGVDPKEVLDRLYTTVRKSAPDLRDIYLAIGDLALEKGDSALAAKHFDEGLRKFPEDPDLHYGRARAFSDSDRKVMGTALEAALKANPRHLASLLQLADYRIDAEDYEGATETLDEIRKTNPHLPEAWAYTAVIAHLRNDTTSETRARTEATKFWDSNPKVPHLIGRKLSQKYRFAEGAALQREALRAQPDFLPAKAQLANDLLRLGEDEAGWELIQEVHEKDGYDVTAYNLVTLKDTMASYTTLTNEHFIVRMHEKEAAIYGPRVMNLLERARSTLAAKFDLTLVEPTTVEIFSEAKDFGVRTFGMPDNPGYLGVCFGRVITANSPAATRSKTVNWEAVLWHEFCHVVTLQLTANKMPRWLSEGISVYEERLANPAWGEALNPKYREMILEGELTPIGKLSAAFLIPKTDLHLQFAYYQASIVVEFLVARFGTESLRKILADLRQGVFINTAIERHAQPLDALEKEFAEYARKKAEGLAPDLDWEKPARRGRGETGIDLASRALSTITGPATNNYYRLMETADRLLSDEKFDEAQPKLELLIERYPSQTGTDSAYAMLARLHRARGDTDAESRVLEQWASVDGEAIAAYLRLMELSEARKDWKSVARNADRYLAVDPLVPDPYRHLARAQENLALGSDAIATYRTLLRLDSPNPSEVHFELARLLEPIEPQAARRHLVQSLEEAPRNRAALRQLLGTNAAPEMPPPPSPGVQRRP
ncbi:MAG: tetratricopeptide repeat protein [Verrucomicrobiales bacterium]|nr:tetratricopeptide repeat protein [Verrucomicrobiales bacterium]